MKKQRMANIELLRMIAMAMVIMLHYLSKGKLLPSMTESFSGNGYVAWILETLSIVAVNVYMLISGYFLAESRFHLKRLIQLLCQILFYSILIPPVLMAFGIIKPRDLTVYQLLQYVFPTQMEHYWFATAYVLMYLMTPVLRAAVHQMNRKQLKGIILLLLLFLSVNKSILPVRLTMDELGYDVLWFLCVFLCAAYMRLYGFKWISSCFRGWCGYFMGCAAMLGITLMIRWFYLKTGIFHDFLIAAYHYNHILNLLTAISLFYAFYHWKPKEGRLMNIILRSAPYTFGVYLLHEHIEIRYLWPQWLGALAEGNPLVFMIRSIVTVVAVLIIGLVIDWIRSMLFAWVGKLLKRTKADFYLLRIDDMMNGDGRLVQQAAERN